MKDYERRLGAKQIEFRGADNGQPVLEGYAAVFDSPSEDMGSWVEIIRPGAFAKTLKESDVRALLNHDSSQVLGRMSNKTLLLAEDDHGLRAEIHPPETAAGRDAVVMVKRGDITGMSFGFRAVRDEVTIKGGEAGETAVREILEAELFEVSPVTFPAYDATEISARALDQVREVLEKTKPEPLTAEGLIERLKGEGMSPDDIRSIFTSGTELLAPDPARQAVALRNFVRRETLEMKAGEVPALEI